ncbi:PilN domain-containing protein [uncultured Pseudoteredinibacter sp.]|uniref:PilN domain-containing protein n=1 Tax=uncultured Pseudoteredinibacter sp. TaxID=1641701 RepID=UPI00262D26F8|nr:PilN domain-containing protein [uncultured Pseudoteredinibacter sp.]
MANINLLPWRDEYRARRKQEYLTILTGVIVIAAALAYLWVSSVQADIDAQNQRNKMLNDEIAILQSKVSEIKELKKRRSELLERMRVIQELQGLRPVIVRAFDEFVRMVPDGIYIISMKRNGNTISMEGVTESNNRVSTFMRNLESSAWFQDPNLNSVTTKPNLGEQASEFSMTVKAAIPKKDESEGGK